VVQSLLLAPLFVWFELLFLLGLYPALYQQLQQRVASNVAEFRAKSEKLLDGQEGSGEPAAPAE
jgi:2-hydroxy fatty acid dioxygenase